MAETKWTPGPWFARHHCESVEALNGRFVADCRVADPALIPENEANARLIVAAPELAAFVEKVRATIAPSIEPDGDDYLNEGGHAAIEALVGEAEALLAKARGE